jgi:hypothetical protein
VATTNNVPLPNSHQRSLLYHWRIVMPDDA